MKIPKFIAIASVLVLTGCTAPNSLPDGTRVSFKLIFNSGGAGGQVPEPKTYRDGDQVTVPGNPGYLARTGYSFGGWLSNSVVDGRTWFPEGATFRIRRDLTLTPAWNKSLPNNSKVGTAQIFRLNGEVKLINVPGGYSFPSGEKDRTRASVGSEYQISETEVTWGLWKTVHRWATSEERAPRDYTFANPGTEARRVDYPVTGISWRDAVVWCNALTEYSNARYGTSLRAAYWDDRRNAPLRDTTRFWEVDAATPKDGADGFRLPSRDEWELAARWRGLDSVNTAVGFSEPYFTKGDSASGAVDDVGKVAWYEPNSNDSTHYVKGKAANALGLFDMSGNVSEWCFDEEAGGGNRTIRGGSYSSNSSTIRIGGSSDQKPDHSSGTLGFRLARFPTVRGNLAIEGSFSYVPMRVAKGSSESYKPFWRNAAPGQTVAYAMNPPPPAGISVDAVTGAITAGPSAAVAGKRIFAITATGVGDYQGTISANASVTVVLSITGSFTYAPISTTKGSSASSKPSWTGATEGQAVSYYGSLSPARGISLDSATGEITVAASAAVQSKTDYKIMAGGTGDYGGTVSGTVSVTVSAPPVTGSFTYAPISTTKGSSASSKPTWRKAGAGQTVSYAISPALPAGMSLDAVTGEITVEGSAGIRSKTDYRVTATGTGDNRGTVSGAFSVTVAVAPIAES